MQVEKETIEVAEILARCHREYAPAAAQAGRSLAIAIADDLPALVVDRALPKLVLINW